MNFESLKQVFKKLDVDFGNSIVHGNDVNVSCPLAPWFHNSKTDHKPSLSVSLNKTPTVFRCFSCLEQGKLWNLIDSYARLADKPELKKFALQIMESEKPSLVSRLEFIASELDDWFNEKELKDSFRKSYVFDDFVFVWLSERAMSYLEERNIDIETRHSFELMYDKKRDRIVCPILDRNEDVCGVVGRIIGDGEPKYYNYFGTKTGNLLGGLHLLSDRPYLLVVEGFFDVLNCWKWAREKYTDVVCTWRAEMSKVQAEMILDMDKTVYVAYDNDKAGEKGWYKIKSLFRDYPVNLKRILLNPGIDIGGLSMVQFNTELEKAKSQLFF